MSCLLSCARCAACSSFRETGRRSSATIDAGPGEDPEQVGADSLPAEVEDAALGVDRRRSDPEVVEETPEGGSSAGGVGGAQARDVEEHEDGERHEERGRPEQHLEQAGDEADGERVEGPDADEGEDRPERPVVGAEAEAADQVDEGRHQDGRRRDHRVAAAGRRSGATVLEDGRGEIAADRADDHEQEDAEPDLVPGRQGADVAHGELRPLGRGDGADESPRPPSRRSGRWRWRRSRSRAASGSRSERRPR